MPTPGEQPPLPDHRRPRLRPGAVLTLPAAAGAEPAPDATAAATEPSPEAAPAAVAEDGPPPVPEVRRRRRPRDQIYPHRPRTRLSLSPAGLTLALLLTLGIGGGAGWLVAGSRPVASAGGSVPRASSPEPTPSFEAVSSNTAEEVESAYATLEAIRPLEARDQFLALASRADPGSRSAAALRAAAAWCELTSGRTEAAEGLLVAGFSRANGGESADTRFLLGIARLVRGEYAEAEKSFARAADLDPTRSDIHLLWGDTLRREGHPRESVPHYRAALRRNRQETNIGFCQLKLWLAQLQSGETAAAEAQAGIAAALSARGFPSGTVAIGAAARATAAGNRAEAADLLRRARQSTELAVFTAALQDPFFAEQTARPEFAEFFSPR